MTQTSNIRRHTQSLRRAFGEMNYAQKRSAEIRTGVPILAPHERPARITRTEDLEFLYAHDASRQIA